MTESADNGTNDGSDADLFRVAFDKAGTRTASHPTRDDIQLMSPDFYANFDECTTWMRANAPLYWDDTIGMWGAASHADVNMMSRDWHTFCSGKGSRPDSSVPSMINMDPPEHTRRRRLVSAGFSLKRVADHEPYLRSIVGKLIDDVIERGECDIVADIATPLPMYMIGELMGLPHEDHAQLLHWSDLFASGDPALVPQITEAVIAWDVYIREKMEQRRGGDGTDLVSLIVNPADDEEPLSDMDVMFETMLVLVGGDETTRHVISGGLEALLRHPEQLDRVRKDPSLVPTAVEEMLRWVSPIKNMNRTATKDVEVNGQSIKEGDRILLLYPSANRDEAAFADPFTFDVARNPNPHVAFGAYGRHHCLGAPLARLELRVIFEEMLRRFTQIELASDAPLSTRRGTFVLGLNELPVSFTP